MPASLLSIGDFSRATHLSVKTLRYYHQEGVLEPLQIDEGSGYRRYSVEQIPTAQVIHRFRDLGMPVEDVRRVISASDPAARNALISRHLQRLEEELGKTQAAVASLRDLLDHPATEWPVEHRRVPAMRVAAITQEVETAQVGPWYQGALGELYGTVSAQGLALAGAAGGVYADGLFADERGEATVYLPVSGDVRELGRVRAVELPPVELAVVTHEGPDAGVDRAYGALASYVTRHALAVAGPIREFYPVSRQHTLDAASWRTEIGWPIFETGGEAR
ncbi:MAG TPA: MerR family transcriptional regulator [Streptosporangiaceae bacterium]|jgi:DNA-binding transcriptional MerR regulator